jgi:glutathione S-transferase
MSEDSVVLYHAWTSTCSQKVRLCLAEKRIPWRGEVLNLRALDHLSDRFLALNPDGMVPVLVHRGCTITESSVINEYLEESFGEPALMPRDAAGRAAVRMWCRYIDEAPTDAIKVPSYQRNLAPMLRSLSPAQLELVRTRMPNRRTADRWLRLAREPQGLTEEELSGARAVLAAMLARMDAALASHEWLAGAAYTLADVNMAPFVVRLASFPEYDLQRDWPGVHAWHERLRARPAFAGAAFIEQSRPAEAQAPGSDIRGEVT